MRARGRPGPFTPVDLAIAAGRPLLLRQPFDPHAFDEVILGCAAPHPDEMNPGRVAALRLGCGERMPAWTVQRNCGSGMQAVDSAARAIADGRAELVLAGGTESLSHAPLLVRRQMVDWLADWRATRSPLTRLRLLARLRPRHFVPVIGLLRGLTDPVVRLNMGQTAELLAHRFAVAREEADTFALESHRRLARAQEDGGLPEVEPAYAANGTCHERDDGVRPDTTMDKLAKLPPAFERPDGSVTAGNSAQITDGAAWLVLASEEAVRRHGLEPIGRIVDSHWAALDPSVMGLGPAIAAEALLTRRGLSPDAIDAWEINEAFAAQVLAVLKAWRDETFCREVLGRDRPVGEIDRARLNVDGGAISLGHPVGASGARIVLHLLHVLRRQCAKRGIATLCVGGGQGGAMLLETA